MLHGPASGSAGWDLALRGVEGSEPGGDSAGRGRLVGGGPEGWLPECCGGGGNGDCFFLVRLSDDACEVNKRNKIISVADQECLPRIRIFFIPDPNIFHPGSELFPFRIPDPQKRI